MGFATNSSQQYYMLQVKLKDLMKESLNMHAEVKTAKTQFKKDYYNKKIKKINNKAANILMALQLVSPSTASPTSPEDELNDHILESIVKSEEATITAMQTTKLED